LLTNKNYSFVEAANFRQCGAWPRLSWIFHCRYSYRRGSAVGRYVRYVNVILRWQKLIRACAGRIMSPTRQSTNAPLNRTSDNSSRPKTTLYLDMLFAYLEPSVPCNAILRLIQDIFMRRPIPPEGEGQGDDRVLCGQVSSKGIGLQGFQLLHPGTALWTVNCGGRTQRLYPATRYDDDDEM